MADVETSPEFEGLLEYVKQSRGFDFTGYKRASLRRRIDKRMRELSLDAYEFYGEHLELHPQEFIALFNTILINVTSFFRDAPTWKYLQDDVLPRRLAALPPDRPIRVWCAGCASGEEAYTLAIVLAELRGVDEFKRRVKIYGTDIDEEALATARAATYDELATAGVPTELRDRYFEQAGEKFAFRADLRRSVIFGRLDILNDAPISRLELLSCRNTLMYFNAETQARAIERFHFALADGGVLFLGNADTMLSDTDLFEPIDRRYRIFTRVPGPRGRAASIDRFPGALDDDDVRATLEMHALALEAVPFPTLLVDSSGLLADANEPAREVFAIGPPDYGHLFQELEVSYRPVELRGPIAQAYSERRSVRVNGVRLAAHDKPVRNADVEVVPLYRAASAMGVAIFFHDVTVIRELEDQLRQSTHELEQAYQEVQSTNEELETTNEELQSTIEEVETTNGELQSTNERLETMNEVLESTNDDLHAVTEELRLCRDELDDLNQFLESILTSFRGGVVVVDAQHRVRVWNPRAEDLWGVRADEVRGVDLASIDIGMPVAALIPPLNAILDSAASVDDVVVDAVTRRGRPVVCRVSFTPLRSSERSTGAILVMEVLESDR